ncbi:MAG: DUF3298 and DUF4163 domain-containing protein [Desulfovibrio sp.]|nr:DUF3298 and DUF4163 domain-containing protein [Desulfovibrio sp.]
MKCGNRFSPLLPAVALVGCMSVFWAEYAASLPLVGIAGWAASRFGAELSAAAQPGVFDNLVKRSNPQNKTEINITYPSLGRAGIDAEIRRWVTAIADEFEENFAGDDATDDDVPKYELQGSYVVTRPSATAISFTFELWTYTGGAHGNLDIITLNYSLLTGQCLDLVDLFEYPDAALKLMSDWSARELLRRFAGTQMKQMILDGTASEAENFANLTLTPDGVTIQFQPYQVAPWAAGAQQVEMPFEELLNARPLAAVWGR